MILVDYSSIIHRKIFTSINDVKPSKTNGLYNTSEFITLTKYYILQELFGIIQEYSTRFGDVILCIDKSDTGYWRKDVYPAYKYRRSIGRDKSDINYKEVFTELDVLLTQIENHLPIKVVTVKTAEADDIMLVLAKEYHKDEEILIHSPDKDMIQAQRDNDTVFQYSALTKKWIKPENKHDHMDHWIIEHVCLGDVSDDVPKVVDHTEFSDTFIKHLDSNEINIKTPHEFKNTNDIHNDVKIEVLKKFNIFKKNRKNESTGIKDVYKDIRFGPSTLKKELKKHGSIDNWLDTHPLYREHYERNYTLVMEEGIPDYIREKIVFEFLNAKTDYNKKDFEEYLFNNNLNNIAIQLPNYFKPQCKLTAADFGW